MRDESTERGPLVRRAIRLEYFTIAYNLLEAAAALGFGFATGSISLQGFGFDSLIETAAASTLLWRLKHESRGTDKEKLEVIERRAERIVGVTFFVLSAYVGFEAIQDLWLKAPPQPSLAGAIIAVFSIVIMIPLALQKRTVAALLGSRALAADAMETFVCVYLSIILLAGTGLHKMLGIWWLDPAASLAMIPFMLKEGWEAFSDQEGD